MANGIYVCVYIYIILMEFKIRFQKGGIELIQGNITDGTYTN